jgi:hypothetical protein
MKAMVLTLSVCFALSVPAIDSSFAQAKDDKRVLQLDEERKKLEKTRSPADRAECLMKIADIHLTYVSDAIAENDPAKLKASAGEYGKTVMQARDTMMKSGLDPYKKPGGYQVVELATRKHLRILEEGKRRLAMADRPIVDEVMGVVTKVHDEVLRALFR